MLQQCTVKAHFLNTQYKQPTLVLSDLSWKLILHKLLVKALFFEDAKAQDKQKWTQIHSLLQSTFVAKTQVLTPNLTDSTQGRSRSDLPV